VPARPRRTRIARSRPVLVLTLGADVAAELRRLAERDGAAVSRISEAALRVGLNLPAQPRTIPDP